MAVRAPRKVIFCERAVPREVFSEMCDSAWKVIFTVKVKQQRFSGTAFSWKVPFRVKQRFPETCPANVKKHVLETCE